MRVFIILFSFVLVFFYLYFSYTKFYRFIANANLKSPYLENVLSIENLNGVGEIKYVALGDSLSAGVGSNLVKNTFVYQYGLNLSGQYAKVRLLNLAQPGSTTQDVVQNQLQQSVRQQPEYVTLLIGTNDIHNFISILDFKRNYQHILQELINKTNSNITVVNIPYLASNKLLYFPFNVIYNLRIKQFNREISNIVKNSKGGSRIKLVDLYSGTYIFQKQDPNYYSLDLFHPSDKGYLFWSKIINAN